MFPPHTLINLITMKLTHATTHSSFTSTHIVNSKGLLVYLGFNTMSIINFTLKNLPEYKVHSNFNPEAIFLLLTLLVCFFLLVFYAIKRTSSRVYLIDFACYKPPETQKCTKEFMMKKARHSGYFSEETVDFMRKVLDKSGVGDSTYLSEVYLKSSPDPCMKESRREMEMSVFGSIDMLLAKTGIRCEEIGILVVNCCIYNTMPSLSSMIVNRYKLKESIASYNLVGMGCSAGLLAIGLAEQLLQVIFSNITYII